MAQTQRQLSSGSTSTKPGTERSTSESGVASDLERRLVLDKDLFEEQFLLCPVCTDKYDMKQRLPKLLPCNHTMCLPCVIQLAKHAPITDQGHKHMTCPSCRAVVLPKCRSISEIPNDHKVVQMLDFLSQATYQTHPQAAASRSHSKCSQHEEQSLFFFCEKCLVPICRDCTVIDHPQAEDHKIISISQAWEKHSHHFDEVQNKCRNSLEKMKGRSDTLADAFADLNMDEENLEIKIKFMFSKFRSFLNKREAEMIKELHATYLETKSKINGQQSVIQQDGVQFQKIFKDFVSSKSSQDIYGVCSAMQEINKREPGFTEMANEDDEELLENSKFQFEISEEKSFLSEISQLGQFDSGSGEFVKTEMRAVALFDYDAADTDELSLVPSQVIRVIDKLNDQGWWKGEINGDIGHFPANFVKLLPS